MYTSVLLSLLPLLAVAAPHQQHGPAMKQGKQQEGMSCTPQGSNKAVKVGKAVYLITNEAENAVIALPIGADGKLSAGKMAKTGGTGSAAVNAEGKPEGPDALVSQSSLTIAGNNLFAVNAGSNTLTMMAISNQDPTALACVGKPVKVPGEFPNTVAASAKNNIACVGTSGAVAGISCASFSSKGIGQMDGLRPFDLGQTTPPVGPLNTVSHTFFSADEKMLFTTVKGDPTVNNTGFLSTFPVEAGQGGANKVSTKGMQSSPNGTAVLFGSAIMAKDPSSLFVTDASFGAAVLKVDSAGQATVQGAGTIEGQKATCWATISDSTNSAFVTDVAVNRVVEMSLDNASIIKELDLSANGDPGLVDLRAAGDFVYALSPGNGTTNAAITVLDVSGGKGSMKQIQHFDLGRMGAGKSAQGMAVML